MNYHPAINVVRISFCSSIWCLEIDTVNRVRRKWRDDWMTCARWKATKRIFVRMRTEMRQRSVRYQFLNVDSKKKKIYLINIVICNGRINDDSWLMQKKISVNYNEMWVRVRLNWFDFVFVLVCFFCSAYFFFEPFYTLANSIALNVNL